MIEHDVGRIMDACAKHCQRAIALVTRVTSAHDLETKQAVKVARCIEEAMVPVYVHVLRNFLATKR